MGTGVPWVCLVLRLLNRRKGTFQGSSLGDGDGPGLVAIDWSCDLGPDCVPFDGGGR